MSNVIDPFWRVAAFKQEKEALDALEKWQAENPFLADVLKSNWI